MKRAGLLLIIFISVAVLAGCGDGAGLALGFDSPESFPPLETVYRAPESGAPVTLPSGEISPEQPKPVHSNVFVEGLTGEDLLKYFNEICLGADENGGNTKLVQKWNTPIYYKLNGAFTDDDLSTLSYVFEMLNAIEGFPGISEAVDQTTVNMQIYFCTEGELLGKLGQAFVGHDGGSIYYHEEDEINSAVVCIRTDLDQYMRNSAILKSICKTLGVMQYSSLRADSAVYNGPNEAQEITPIDEAVFKVLYSPKTMHSMSSADIERVIGMIYY